MSSAGSTFVDMTSAGARAAPKEMPKVWCPLICALLFIYITADHLADICSTNWVAACRYI